jgi:hypothetical protein
VSKLASALSTSMMARLDFLQLLAFGKFMSIFFSAKLMFIPVWMKQ